VRVFAIAPGETRVYDPAEWHGAIVVVERGAIDLEGLSGRRWRFRQGDVLYLADLPLRALCNEGAEAALLSALSRTKQTVAAHS
jgi:hypothetical protein